MEWSGYNWLTHERWGQIHPDKPYCYYDESAVLIDQNNHLNLITHYNPKYFDEIESYSTVGIGLVSCTTQFGHGYFEISAKLPTGDDLWPAFWMWAFESYPPEIDVFEGYSEKSNYWNWMCKGSYNPFKLWKVQSNVHVGTTDNIIHARAKNHCFTLKNPSKKFIKYGCLWAPDKIEIFYNGLFVRRIKKGIFLKGFENKTLNVIINNSIQNDTKMSENMYSNFQIEYFKYEPL